MDYNDTEAPVEMMPPPDLDDRILAAVSPKIDRILAAVGSKIVPPDLDRYGLWNALRGESERYRAFDEFRSGDLWKNRGRELRELGRLSLLMRSQLWPLRPPHQALHAMENWCRSMLTELEQGWHPGRWHPALEGRSMIDLLVGDFLPPNFKRYLKRPPSTTPKGPYVRFALQVLKEFNITKSNGEAYKAGTIVQALIYARKGYSRSKGRKVSQATKPEISNINWPAHLIPPF